MNGRCPDCQDIINVSSNGRYFDCDCGWVFAITEEELKIMAIQQWHLRNATSKKVDKMSKEIIDEINKEILRTVGYGNISWNSASIDALKIYTTDNTVDKLIL